MSGKGALEFSNPWKSTGILSCRARFVTVAPMTLQKTSFTILLTPPQQQKLARLLREGNYRLIEVPHAVIAAETPDCRIALFHSNKCLVQGRGAKDWVIYHLEPEVLGTAQLGYEDIHDPQALENHMGVDESGKGDFFGPLVIAAVYSDRELVHAFRRLNVRDSKTITSDRVALDMARELRKLLGSRRYSMVTIGPAAYNRLYAQMRNVNRILAWGHARAIENVLENNPACATAVSDQFGPVRQIESALQEKGRKIRLVQRPRAESDPAVAAASVLARAEFLEQRRKLGSRYGVSLPKGASDAARRVAVELAREHGPQVLLETAKCHFKTTDAVLADLNLTRAVLGPQGACVSKALAYKKPRPHNSEG